MNDNRVVVFDLGGVLLNWSPRYLFEKIFQDAAELDRFLGEICTMDWHLRHDAGVPFAENRKPLIQEYPHYKDQITAFGDRWREMFRGAMPGSPELLQDVKATGRPTFALTNFSHEKWEDLLADYEFMAEFDDVLVSGAEKLVKPDPAIYHLMFEKFGIAPEQTVFIDDSRNNITSARALGIEAIHFQDSGQVRKDLEDLGIL